MHPAIVAKALKRSKNMLSRKELEEIIKAWPDENGISSNPEVFHNWIEIERDHCRTRIRYALGYDRIEALSERQYRLLEKSLERLFSEKSHWQITDEEIIGKYEIVTEYMSPLNVENYVEALKKREKLH